jgi:hypothetical protein
MTRVVRRTCQIKTAWSSSFFSSGGGYQSALPRGAVCSPAVADLEFSPWWVIFSLQDKKLQIPFKWRRGDGESLHFVTLISGGSARPFTFTWWLRWRWRRRRRRWVSLPVLKTLPEVHRSYRSLRDVVEEAWDSITVATIQKLIREMGDRCIAVTLAEGGYTKY